MEGCPVVDWRFRCKERGGCLKRPSSCSLLAGRQGFNNDHLGLCRANQRSPAAVMAGMPLFAHAGHEKLTPSPLPVPLKL